MRTKVLVGLAALAAGAFTAVAQQNVYSLNVVGYINLPMIEGFNLVANQLDADGTGTNNTVAGVFSTNLPLNSKVYLFDPAASSYNIASYAVPKGGTSPIWTYAPASASYSLNPGQGAWVSIPTGAFGGQTQNVTTVGQVLQGNLSNPYLLSAGGFALVSSQIPLAGGLTTTLGYQPQYNTTTKAGDKVYLYDPVAVNYTIASYGVLKGGTTPVWSINGVAAEPQVAVGQGFWLNSLPGATWTTNFTVQ